MVSESALRSTGALLSRVRAPPLAPWPDGGSEILRSSCCGQAIYKNQIVHVRLVLLNGKLGLLRSGDSKGGEENNDKLSHNAVCLEQSRSYSWFPDSLTKRRNHLTDRLLMLVWFCDIAIPQQDDLKLSGPLSGQGADDEIRTCDIRSLQISGGFAIHCATDAPVELLIAVVSMS
ncbi:hypothetical protein PoB_007260600 [Plakobranchus ocellatus]|uniref:Uncharacterized protein n=1 Tax=Plakobranchus ocellatus TaxID=259542 RepID=A0AAV4DPR4_9GAST|nr:hypothetical protein PoB_007260600 [Plakobranchus ocellatus]